MSTIALDPGEHTGWALRDDFGGCVAGTVNKFTCNDGSLDRETHLFEVYDLLNEIKPDKVVIERFNLYPGMAKSLSWNSFFPCEVIGIVRLWCTTTGTACIEQAPGVKKYAGGFGVEWDYIKNRCKNITEHSKDAYQHLRYYERNCKK